MKPVLRNCTGRQALHCLSMILAPVTRRFSDEKPVSSMLRLRESIRMTKQDWALDLLRCALVLGDKRSLGC